MWLMMVLIFGKGSRWGWFAINIVYVSIVIKHDPVGFFLFLF